MKKMKCNNMFQFILCYFYFIYILNAMDMDTNKEPFYQDNINILTILRHNYVAESRLDNLTALLPLSLKDIVMDPDDIVLTKEIGRGFNGVVYLANLISPSNASISTDTLEGTTSLPVVVKKLLKDPDIRRIRRFLREADIMVKLANPKHVVPILAVGYTSPNNICMVLPYFPHGTLVMDYFDKEIPKNEKTSLKYIEQMFHAFSYMHANGYTHRDGHGGNMFLDEKNNLVLGDFGLSKKSMTDDDIRKDVQKPIHVIESKGLLNHIEVPKRDKIKMLLQKCHDFKKPRTIKGECSSKYIHEKIKYYRGRGYITESLMKRKKSKHRVK